MRPTMPTSQRASPALAVRIELPIWPRARRAAGSRNGGLRCGRIALPHNCPFPWPCGRGPLGLASCGPCAGGAAYQRDISSGRGQAPLRPLGVGTLIAEHVARCKNDLRFRLVCPILWQITSGALAKSLVSAGGGTFYGVSAARRGIFGCCRASGARFRKSLTLVSRAKKLFDTVRGGFYMDISVLQHFSGSLPSRAGEVRLWTQNALSFCWSWWWASFSLAAMR